VVWVYVKTLHYLRCGCGHVLSESLMVLTRFIFAPLLNVNFSTSLNSDPSPHLPDDDDDDDD